MSNTRDHAEVCDVRAALGLDAAGAPARKKRWSLAGSGLARAASRSRSRASDQKARDEKPRAAPLVEDNKENPDVGHNTQAASVEAAA